MIKTYLTTTLFAILTTSAMAGSDMKEIAPPQVSTSDAGTYIAVFGGANFAQDYGNKRTEVSSPFLPGLAIDVRGTDSSDHIGGVGGIKFGYNFESIELGGDFRFQPAVEGEVFYLGTKQNVSYNQTVVGVPVSASITNDQNNVAFMVNGIGRFKTGTLVTPYVGAGIGAEYFDVTNASASISSPISGSVGLPSTNDITLALQGLIGVEFQLADHWSLFTEYKYLAAINPSFAFGNTASLGGIGIDGKFDPDYIGQHLGIAGIKYSF